jgi:hypothetical protein
MIIPSWISPPIGARPVAIPELGDRFTSPHFGVGSVVARLIPDRHASKRFPSDSAHTAIQFDLDAKTRLFRTCDLFTYLRRID